MTLFCFACLTFDMDLSHKLFVCLMACWFVCLMVTTDPPSLYHWMLLCSNYRLKIGLVPGS